MAFWDFTIGDLIAICLVPVAVAGGYYIRKWLKPHIQITQENNQVSAYQSIFLHVNRFDNFFKGFFHTFEVYFGSFKELESRFLPLNNSKITRITHKGTKEETITITFDLFMKEDFVPGFTAMKLRLDEVLELQKITNNVISIKLSGLLLRYMQQTIQYMEFFEKGENRKYILEFRYDWANEILKEIETSNLIKQFPCYEIETFVNKWNDYKKDNP